MAIRNTFNASGNQTVDSLRRAVNNGFSSLVTQLNTSDRPKTGPVLPLATSRIPPLVGDVFVLTERDGTNAPGEYIYDGTSWSDVSGGGGQPGITQDAADARYLRTVPDEFLTQNEGDARYLRTVPAEFLTQTEGDGRYIQTIPDEFLTQTEGDARYLQTIPADVITETTGDARYLQSVPSEFLTQTEGDGRYLRSVPASVTNLNVTGNLTKGTSPNAAPVASYRIIRGTATTVPSVSQFNGADIVYVYL